MLWEVDIHPTDDRDDTKAAAVRSAAAHFPFGERLAIRSARGFLIEGDLDGDAIQSLVERLLVDPLVERAVVGAVGDPAFAGATDQLFCVRPKPGVMDPIAQSAAAAFRDLGVDAEVGTLAKYWVRGLSTDEADVLCSRILANDAIENVTTGPLELTGLESAAPYNFTRIEVPIRSADDTTLTATSRDGQLSLSIEEMRAIQEHFKDEGRDPTDVELETIAQTWSEHCSHKTLMGRIEYRDSAGARHFQNLLKETIFAATQTLRERWGEEDWCVSVFKDNAGVVMFDDEHHVVFKVETHNHPSAIEPYGGANTGIGGVIRDPLGTGLGAKPVCNTDVFCFAPVDCDVSAVPPGALHPLRIMHGVVSGVRDYGNRMGIPTVNGAIYFDPRYIGNPLVYCGTAGTIPCSRVEKAPQPGDHIVVVGGRTGRDGIHGATFSSIELDSTSETTSGGAVQIGNAITEKMMLDVILQARDRGLYHAITDCGAGGLSSAVGEMGEDVGARVDLERVPLKYTGLSYTEIWISEAQERMVLSVPPHHWDEFSALCAAENVEATVIGEFVPSGRLQLSYRGHSVADLSMRFLHDGRPPVIRAAHYAPAPVESWNPRLNGRADFERTLLAILGSPNVASKEWVIRQYDHEVQAGSVVKPLVGATEDGPSDAAVVRPKLDSYRGIVLSVGMNPRYGDLDTYHMATSAVDEAIRNCVAVGADPDRIALLDNFCWGNTDHPETLGSLVRAALGLEEMALALGTPFISGKDSLNNEFRFDDSNGEQQRIAIPPSLLISAMGQIPDARQAVTMDAKSPGNSIYLVGETRDELGGSHLGLILSETGGSVPKVDAQFARTTFRAVHAALRGGYVRACHDLSEGGLAVALAEMAFAGGLGIEVDIASITGQTKSDTVALFSESNTRFLFEVRPEALEAFKNLFDGLPLLRLGSVAEHDRLRIVTRNAECIIDCRITDLKSAWQKPFDW